MLKKIIREIFSIFVREIYNDSLINVLTHSFNMLNKSVEFF